jgi:hypothetical protein
LNQQQARSGAPARRSMPRRCSNTKFGNGVVLIVPRARGREPQLPVAPAGAPA